MRNNKNTYLDVGISEVEEDSSEKLGGITGKDIKAQIVDNGSVLRENDEVETVVVDNKEKEHVHASEQVSPSTNHNGGNVWNTSFDNVTTKNEISCDKNLKTIPT
ncbi:hypothetical protein Tco_0198184 [Tanacetum coccineum]